MLNNWGGTQQCHQPTDAKGVHHDRTFKGRASLPQGRQSLKPVPNSRPVYTRSGHLAVCGVLAVLSGGGLIEKTAYSWSPFIRQSEKGQMLMSKFSLLPGWFPSFWGWGHDYKGPPGNFLKGENVFFHDLGNGYMTVCICKVLLNRLHKFMNYMYVNHTSVKLPEVNFIKRFY